MFRHFPALLAGVTVLFLARDAFAAEPTDSWVGQKVLAHKADASLTDTGKDGKRITLPVRHIVYTVVAEDGDRIRVNYPGQEGWAPKAEWVRLSDAMDHFTARIKADPKDAFAWSRRGVANRYAGKPDLALKDLEEAVRLAPKDADLVGIRGMMWWANKKLDEAIADYTEAVKLDPTYAVGFRNRAMAWRAKGDFNKALADYTESARVAPHYVPAFHERGIAWREKGEPRKALDDLTEAVRLDLRYAAAMADLARLLATCTDDKLRDGKRALELATKANELTGGKDASVLDALAAAYAETSDFDKAVEFQKKALADKAFEKDIGEKGRARLKLYEQKKPWRE
jgi:tetratricopeptide (TPR) repeat protein